MEALEFRFAFFACDFERSVRFYREILGMALVGGWDREDGKGALLCAGGKAVIEIYGAAEGQEYVGPKPAAINLAIRLPGKNEVDQAYAAFVGASCPLEGPPIDHPWGHRAFVIYDPDGIPVHIYCELK